MGAHLGGIERGTRNGNIAGVHKMPIARKKIGAVTTQYYFAGGRAFEPFHRGQIVWFLNMDNIKIFALHERARVVSERKPFRQFRPRVLFCQTRNFSQRFARGKGKGYDADIGVRATDLPIAADDGCFDAALRQAARHFPHKTFDAAVLRRRRHIVQANFHLYPTPTKVLPITGKPGMTTRNLNLRKEK
ncbi:MAG: hypothetical protein HDKAJFGB_03562 [Anaerolineae bacterium]|nr:hypothetical protein [Anaerolineae bacterium]